jgi:hypothetical protein
MVEKRVVLDVPASGTASATIRMEVWFDGVLTVVPVTPKPTPSPFEDAARHGVAADSPALAFARAARSARR